MTSTNTATASQAPQKETFESKFRDVLVTELRRQGIVTFVDLGNTILSGIRRIGLTGLSVNASRCHLNDRGCVALVETMLKMTGHPGAPSNWEVDLSSNEMTDRVAGHIALLVKRCTKLQKLDISSNPALSSASEQSILAAGEAIRKGANPMLIISISQLPSQSQQQGPHSAATSSAPAAPTSSSPAVSTNQDGMGSSVTDVAGLRRRRESSLHKEDVAPPPRVPSSQTANPVKSQPVSPRPRSVSPSTQPRAARTGDANKTPHALAEPRTRNSPSATQHDAPTSLATKTSKTTADRNPTGHSPPPVASKGSATAVATTTTTSTQQLTERLSRPKSISDSNVKHRPSSQGSKAASSRPSASVAKPLASNNIHRASSIGSLPVTKVGANNNNNHNNEDDDDSRSTVSTTATEVPDQQDYLDITANMNPLIDNMVSLENQNVSADVLHRRLRQALSPTASFSSITIVNLASNHLLDFDGTILPETLLRVDLSDNQLNRVPTFASSPMLSVINLRRNRIQHVGNALEHNLNVGHLFLGRNDITFVDGIGHLWMLETLDLSFNRIQSSSQLRPLSLNTALRHLLLKGNPVEGALKGSYRPVLRNLIPSLIAVDNERMNFSRVAENKLIKDQKLGQNILDAMERAGSPRSDAASPRPTQRAAVGYAVRNMLSRGIAGVAAGYSEHTHVVNSTKQIQQTKSKAVNGSSSAITKRASRTDVITKLCAKSKQFLEKTIVERLTAADRMRDLQGIQEMERRRNEEQNAAAAKAAATARIAAEEEAARNEALAAEAAAAAQRVSVRRSEPLVVDDPWTREKSRARTVTPSPPPDRPTLGNSGQRVIDGILQGASSMPSSPVATDGQTKPMAVSQGALAYRHTASSLERARSRSASNASSRSPSPTVTADQRALPIFPNEPLNSAVKHANTPRSARVTSGAAVPLLHMGMSPRAAQPRLSSMGEVGKKGLVTPTRALYVPLTSPYANSEEIILSPEGPSAMSPSGLGLGPLQINRDVSPIRGSLDITDVSDVGDADKLVPRMDPGAGASPVPRSTARTVAMTPISKQASALQQRKQTIVSPSAEVDSIGQRSTAGIPPLHGGKVLSPPPPLFVTHPSQRPDDVAKWMKQFKHDLDSITMTLKTVVDLIWSTFHATDESIGATLMEERTRCLEIISHSNILEDTELPVAVIRHFGYRLDELNDAKIAQEAASNDTSDRGVMLEAIHEMGSSKTCLRYVLALASHNKEDLLKRYVEGIRTELYG